MRLRDVLLLASLVVSASLAAQSVRGTVVSREGAGGVAGVVVLLVDSTGAVVGRALSDHRGDYRLQAPRLGTFRIRTMRVGFRPDTFDIRFAGSQELESNLALASISARLDTVRVLERNVCGADVGSDATAAVWDQARTAMLAADMSTRTRSIQATIVSYTRTLDANSGRVRSQESGIISGLTSRPWATPSPDVLRRDGYIVIDRNGAVAYYAPDLNALLSPNFVADHCFRVRRTRDTTVLGISFEPSRDRASISGIQGTLWLNRQTAELRRLEFRYVNMRAEYVSSAGGGMEFARMKNGGWAIASWFIKMPVLERVERDGGRTDLRIAEVQHVGGDLSYVVRGADTLFAREPLALRGTVQDSLTGAPLEGVKLSVSNTNLSTVTDSRGRFTIEAMLPGQYVIELRTVAYEAINAHVDWPLLFAGADDQPRIRIPSAAQLVAARTAVFAGLVFADSSRTPLAGATVAVPGQAVGTLTDTRGAFRIEGLAPGEHEVQVRRLGYEPMTASLTFTRGRTTERQVFLPRLIVLDSVIVEASRSDLSFAEHRRLGLGSFLAIEELEKHPGRPMAAVLSAITSLGIFPGTGSSAYVKTKHEQGDLGIAMGFERYRGGPDVYERMRASGHIPPHIWCPDPRSGPERTSGLKCGCYSKVYVDDMLMNPGKPTEPFNINMFTSDDLESIEYYATPAQVPMKYAARDPTCGVLVLHRRRNAPKLRAPKAPPPS